VLFEGPEKKVEVVISSEIPSLRSYKDLWPKIVDASGAKILSSTSTEFLDAYLLSESSLFVYDHRFVMITCGTTRLVNSTLKFLDTFSIDHINSLIYERKNEIFPHSQPTGFIDDAITLKKHIPGKAFRFGPEDGNHVSIFHMDRYYNPGKDDVTLEILMHGINSEVFNFFSSDSKSAEEIRKKTLLDSIYPGFHIHDHIFKPSGYSINSIKEKYYYTIHVTPQKIGSYISFETNLLPQQDSISVCQKVLETFKPASFVIVLFQDERFPGLKNSDYSLKNEVCQKLECGYNIQYSHYFKPQDCVQSATELPLGELISGENNV